MIKIDKENYTSECAEASDTDTCAGNSCKWRSSGKNGIREREKKVILKQRLKWKICQTNPILPMLQ